MNFKSKEDLELEIELTKNDLDRFENEFENILEKHDYFKKYLNTLQESIDSESWRIGKFFKITNMFETTYYMAVNDITVDSIFGNLIRVVQENDEDGMWKTARIINGSLARIEDMVYDEITETDFNELWEKYKNVETIDNTKFYKKFRDEIDF